MKDSTYPRSLVEAARDFADEPCAATYARLASEMAAEAARDVGAAMRLSGEDLRGVALEGIVRALGSATRRKRRGERP